MELRIEYVDAAGQQTQLIVVASAPYLSCKLVVVE